MVADPEQEVRSLAKKVLWILFAVVLVLALAVAGVTGYFWYQNNHIFVEDAVYPINAKTLDLRGRTFPLSIMPPSIPSCRTAKFTGTYPSRSANIPMIPRS